MKIKCIDNKGNAYLTVGKVYKAWFDKDGRLWSEHDRDSRLNLSHGNLNVTAHGVFEIVKEEKSHPHADLMLKYAMIAQYDDKPWESFEVMLDGEWKECEHEGLYAGIKYRLKPQEPKIQVGQIWVSKEGVEVMVITPSHEKTIYFSFDVCGYNYKRCVPTTVFLKNFKLKENK